MVGQPSPPTIMQFSITKKATNDRRKKNPLAGDQYEEQDEQDARKQIEEQSKRNAQKAARIQDQYGEETFAYDEVYDAMKKGQERVREKNEGQTKGNQARYMEGILAAAEVRKRDKERARDAKLRREREEEGDEFKDKERFVTGAYKRQQEEIRRQEKEEEEQQLKRNKSAAAQGGLSSMYRQLLNESQQANEAAMEAAASFGKDKSTKVVEEEEKEKLVQPKPTGVTVNDEGEIVDKRQLLKPGLNVKKDEEEKKPSQPKRARASVNDEGETVDKRQLLKPRLNITKKNEDKKRQHHEEEEKEERPKLDTKTHKTEADISSAKARYLARKAKQQEH